MLINYFCPATDVYFPGASFVTEIAACPPRPPMAVHRTRHAPTPVHLPILPLDERRVDGLHSDGYAWKTGGRLSDAHTFAFTEEDRRTMDRGGGDEGGGDRRRVCFKRTTRAAATFENMQCATVETRWRLVCEHETINSTSPLVFTSALTGAGGWGGAEGFGG